MVTPIFWLIGELLRLYAYAVAIAVILSMLMAFGVLDSRNTIVWSINEFFHRITEPALRPIRRRLPDLGGVDISPMILILLLIATIMLLDPIRRSLLCGCLDNLWS